MMPPLVFVVVGVVVGVCSFVVVSTCSTSRQQIQPHVLFYDPRCLQYHLFATRRRELAVV